MDLQRADARCQIYDAFETADITRFLHPFHERMCTKAQIEVEFRRPVLDQQIFVAGLSIHHLHLPGIFRNAMQDRIIRFAASPGQCGNDSRHPKMPDGCVLQLFQRKRLLCRHPVKTHAITRFELPHFP